MGSIGEPNGHVDLPDKNSADIRLVNPTEEELIAQQTANSSEWRGALSFEAYLRREVHLAHQLSTRDGGLTFWVLVHQTPGTSQRQVLCGCETYRKKALVSVNGRVEEVIAHGVGSVFCPPTYRGRGYAGRMMADLGKRLQSWQSEADKRVLFSVLYSDIGKQYYARNGWQAFPSSQISLGVSPSSKRSMLDVRMLRSEDLAELCAMDEELVRRRMSKSSNADRTEVALVPDYPAVQIHHAREEFLTKELFDRTPEIKGAIVGEPGSRVWCYWNRVYPNPQEGAPNTMHILRLVIEDEHFSDFAAARSEDVAHVKDSATVNAIAALFEAAQAEASRWEMKEVQIWNPTTTTLAAARKADHTASVEHRETSSIAALRWYGEGSWESLEWICNEKYGWC